MWISRFLTSLKRDCRNITLHGFVNISEFKSAWELVFWLSVQMLCFALCLWLMTIHWLRYQSRPTVTTIKSTAYPISELSFPAVTICNSNVVHKRQFDYYQKLLLKEGVNETKIMDFSKNLKQLIYFNLVENLNPGFEEIENLFSKYGISAGKLMRNVMHPCGEMLDNCIWSSVPYNCSQLFRPIKTGLGYCCSFNYFNDIADMNAVPEPFKTPMLVDGAGLAHGLSVSVNIGPEDYLSPILPFYACLVLIHSIWDFSDLLTFSITIQPGDMAMMRLIPTVFTADEKLRTVPVSKRNCWFNNEGHLDFNRDYSFTNCVAECKEKTIYKLCQCVPFYYPSENRKQCTLRDVACLKKNELLYNSIRIAGSGTGNTTFCDCLPQCEDISYDGYVNMIRSTLSDTASQLYIYFDHSWCVEYNQNLNLTWDILLASMGGIFGLCLGGSLISLIECVYYIVKNIITACVQGKQVKPSIPKGRIQVVDVKPKY